MEYIVKRRASAKDLQKYDKFFDPEELKGAWIVNSWLVLATTAEGGHAYKGGKHVGFWLWKDKMGQDIKEFEQKNTPTFTSFFNKQ